MFVISNAVSRVYQRYAENSAGSGAKTGDNKVSGLVLAEDFVGMSDASEEPQKQINAKMEFVSK